MRRPTLDLLFARALAAIADVKTRPSAETAEKLVAADDAFLQRCPLTGSPGTTRGRGRNPSAILVRAKENPIEFASVLEEEIYLTDTLIRCKNFEKSRQHDDRRERDLSRSIGDALELEAASSRGRSHLRHQARGKNVVLYHGTTSKFLPAIYKNGIVADRNLVEHQPTNAVFLTAQRDGVVSAVSYAARAVHKYGGKPTILTVVVPFDDLELDGDDADIASGDFQFQTDRVEPDQIVAVNDTPRRR